MNLGASALSFVDQESDLQGRRRYPINLTGGHHQRHHHTDSIRGILANPILTRFGDEG